MIQIKLFWSVDDPFEKQVPIEKQVNGWLKKNSHYQILDIKYQISEAMCMADDSRPHTSVTDSVMVVYETEPEKFSLSLSKKPYFDYELPPPPKGE